jgi:hypothetical protein
MHKQCDPYVNAILQCDPYVILKESELRRWSKQLGFQFRNAHGGTFELWRKSLGSTHLETLLEVQEFLEMISQVLAEVRDLGILEGR